MTTPGGVPNLPQGALTIGTLATKLEDTSGPAMRDRAAERFPAIMGVSSGGNPLSNLSPFGILTRIWAEFNSAVANADPADIQGPDDLPGLLMKFIEDLPVVGEFVGLLEAILGNYEGDDEVLLKVQELFQFLRSDGMIDASKLFDLADEVLDRIPALKALIAGAKQALDVNQDGQINVQDLSDLFTGKALAAGIRDAALSGAVTAPAGSGNPLADAIGGAISAVANLWVRAKTAQSSADTAYNNAGVANAAAGNAQSLADNVRLVVQAASGSGSNPVAGLQVLFDVVRGVRSSALQGVADAAAAGQTASSAAGSASSANAAAAAAQADLGSTIKGLSGYFSGQGSPASSGSVPNLLSVLSSFAGRSSTTSATADKASGVAGNAQASTTAVQAQVLDLVARADAGYSARPLWASMDYTADPTFPLSELDAHSHRPGL